MGHFFIEGHLPAMKMEVGPSTPPMIEILDASLDSEHEIDTGGSPGEKLRIK